MEKKDKIACFIHSCTMDLWKTHMLDYMVDYLDKSELLRNLDYLFINNVGDKIDTNLYHHISDKIIIINNCKDTGVFENSTLRLIHFFSQYNSDYKILYFHTKGVSHDKSSPYYEGIIDWINFMLYCLVDNHIKCLEMLDYVDVVGCDYRDKKYYTNPSHFSGNFWWTTSEYIKSLSVYELNGKYDAEFWLFTNNPTFVNIHTCPYGHYENTYKPFQYADTVQKNISSILYNLQTKDKLSILYGVENNYIDVSDICYNQLCVDGVLRIPSGDGERNILFTDPLIGVIKHIKIGDMKYSFKDDIAFRVHTKILDNEII